jgi:hypothetical protein
MARLLRLLPDSASPHELRSVDPSKIAFVSLAAMANQAKPLRGVAPSRRSKVCRSGRSCFTNWALAHVRTSGGPTSPTQRQFRVARSSPNLCACPSLTRSNRRWYGPICPVVWEGWRREASPYPDHAQIATIRRRLARRVIRSSRLGRQRASGAAVIRQRVQPAASARTAEMTHHLRFGAGRPSFSSRALRAATGVSPAGKCKYRFLDLRLGVVFHRLQLKMRDVG